MAAGNRNSKGKPADIVKHRLNSEGITMCGRVKFGYGANDWNDTDCKNCLKIRDKAIADLMRLTGSNTFEEFRNKL